MKLNKAAMFGLDARIALAIFGALSVISGAALYSAIQESKIIQLRTTVSELEKAIEAYYLDTGEFLPYVESTNIETIDISYLVDGAGKSLWKGPYISVKEHARTLGTDIGYIVLDQYPSVKWYLTFTDPMTQGKCSSSSINCKVYLRASSLSSSNNIFEPSLIRAYHDRYDKDADYNKGDMIVVNYVNSSGVNVSLPWQSIQIRP